MAKGYAAPIWMTFKQVRKLGGQIRKGEHGLLVVYANTITRTEFGENGTDIRYLRHVTHLVGSAE